MHIEIPTATLELTIDEIRTVYYSIKSAIEHTIDVHWVNHPDVFDKNESSRLGMLRQLAPLAGHDYGFDYAAFKKQLDNRVAEAAKNRIFEKGR